MRFVLIVWLGLFSWWAIAQPEPPKKTKEELQQIFIEAETAFQARSYQRALDGYLLLYQETQQSDMLFNVAQCLRFLNRYTASIESYQTYLKEQPASPKRGAINEVIVLMQEKLKEQAEQQKQARRRNLVLSGSLLLTSAVTGTASILIAQQAKEEGNFPQSKRNQATGLAVVADVALISSGVFLFFVVRPKKTTYTLEFSLSPTQTYATLKF